MLVNKQQILQNHCYTELVYQRINKKLQTSYSKLEIQKLLKRIVAETSEDNFKKIGKNFYISNVSENIRITVNANTYRIITVDRL